MFNMFDVYIRKENLVKRQWNNADIGISICQFILPASAEKVCLFLPENHSTSSLELLFCMEGRMTVCGSDNLSHTAQKGRILILSDSCKAFSLEVQMKLSGILASLNLKRVQDTACTALGMDLKLMDLLRKLETEHGLLLLPDHNWNKDIFDQMAYLPENVFGQCYFLKMLEFLLVLDAQKENMELTAASQNCTCCNRNVLAAQAYMKKHLSEKVTITDLCRVVSLSPTYLKTEFQRACGKSIHRWFVELRIHRAAELISDTKLPIYKIAQKVGYESMSQFSSAFKRQYGVTPGKYKKMSKTETECPIP